MFCKKCGAEIRLNAKFCAKCGTAVPVMPEKPITSVAPEKPVAPVTPITPEKPVVPTTPETEVESLFKREDVPERAIKSEEAEAVEEKPELVVTMGEMGSSSSNGQFNEWFSEPGDLE